MRNTLHKYFIPGDHNNYHPHILHTKRAVFYAIFFTMLKLFIFSFAIFLPAEVFVLPDVLSEERRQIVDLTNEVRKNNYRQLLKTNNRLDSSAQAKADDMAVRKYFAHSRNKKTLVDWLKAANYNFEVAGENLAVGFKTPKEVVDAWVKSPTHFSNLVDGEFTEFGVGLSGGVFNGAPAIYIAEHLASPAAEQNNVNDVTVNSYELQNQVAISPSGIGYVLGEKIRRISAAVPIAMNTAGSTPYNKYLHAKTVLSPITSIFSVSQNIFLASMIFFALALCLKVFIKIRKQHPIIIAQTGVLVIILFVYWKF
jgi:hypothetical protein